MTSYFEQIKNNVYTLTGLEKSPKLDLQIESSIAQILAYCYRDELTDKMVLPVSEVIASSLNNQAMAGFDGQIANYREGDMSISFAGAGSTSTETKYNGKLEGFKLIRGLGTDV